MFPTMASMSIPEQTYCIPFRDIVSLKPDRQNLIVTVFKHPRTQNLQNQLQALKTRRTTTTQTQTQVQTILEKFIYDKEVEYSRGNCTAVVLQKQFVQRESRSLTACCSILVQTMQTGKQIDSLEYSINAYISNLERRIKELQDTQQAIRGEPQSLTAGSSSPNHGSLNLCLPSVLTQTGQAEIEVEQAQRLAEQMRRMEHTLSTLYHDNVALIEAKTQCQLAIATHQQTITDLNTQLSRITLQNGQMKSQELVLSRKVSQEPIRHRLSLKDRNKDCPPQLRSREIDSVLQQNRLLKQHIEAIRNQKHVQLASNNVLVQALECEDQVSRHSSGDQRLTGSRLKVLQQKFPSCWYSRPQYSTEQSNTPSFKSYSHQKTSTCKKSQEQRMGTSPRGLQTQWIQVLEMQNKELLAHGQSLRKQLQIQRESVLSLEAKNQNLQLQMTQSRPSNYQQTCPQNSFGSSQIAHSQLQDPVDLRKANNQLRQTVVDLQGLIAQYQNLIEHLVSIKQVSPEDGRSCVWNLQNQVTNLENTLQFICRARHQGTDLGIQRVHLQCKREKTKRLLAEGKLDRLSQTLADYQKDLAEKQEKINDLNFVLLDLEEKANFLEYNAQKHSYNKPKFERRPRHTRNASQYDLGSTRTNQHLENTISQPRLRQTGPNEPLIASRMERARDQHTLEWILDTKQLSLSEQSLLIVQLVEALQNNPSAWKFDLTPGCILLSPQNLHVQRIEAKSRSKVYLDSLYISPEELSRNRSEASIVWRTGMIIDKIIHKDCFFGSTQEIADPKVYQFRSREPQFEGVSKILAKALVRSSASRTRFRQFLGAIKHQLAGGLY